MSKAIENTALVTVVLINDSTGIEFVEGRGIDKKAAIDAAVSELGKIGGTTYTWEEEYAGYSKSEGDWLFRVQEGEGDEAPVTGRIIVQEAAIDEEEAA
ncbi:hypothetical protein [Gellertiella hungarica]|uniref:Uncharacterized protein n=1 Tax=Gellertiella hungarica TaxID=1572859 RepID=A0A7W6NJ72_9HYPH|nr:hypothetical protein [Gellertiella hungarica]MBB4064070.1 hypothetical protein [Gellertiella hungarica]